MKRALAISAGAHAVVGGVITLAWHRAAPDEPRDDAVAVEIAPQVAAAPTAHDVAVLAPTLPRHSTPPSSRAAAQVPPRKSARAEAPSSKGIDSKDAPPPKDALPSTDVSPSTDRAAPSTDLASGSADNGGDRGTGGGSGSGGRGNGAGGIDLHAPPVPIDASSARVLPYTEAAMHAHVSGDVVLSLQIDVQGTVTDATVMKRLGYGLDEIAIDVAKRFRFHPARDIAGAPSTGHVSWRFHFAAP